MAKTEIVVPVPVGESFYKIQRYGTGGNYHLRIVSSRVTGYRLGKNGLTVQSTKFYSMPAEEIDNIEFFASLDNMRKFYSAIPADAKQRLEALITEFEKEATERSGGSE